VSVEFGVAGRVKADVKVLSTNAFFGIAPAEAGEF